MLLAVDIGNTQTTLGLFETNSSQLSRAQNSRSQQKHSSQQQLNTDNKSQTDSRLQNLAALHHWRMTTDKSNTADEIHSRLFTYFTMSGYIFEDVDAIAIASVVPLLTRTWQLVSARAFDKEAYIIDATQDCGIQIALPHPEQIGADRIANAVGALSSYKAPAIVVDFGTATNIDVIDAFSCFRGGAIMPGLLSSAGALFEHAARLASVPLEAPEHALGTTTETAVQSGIVIGAAAQAEGIVKRITAELAAEYGALTTENPDSDVQQDAWQNTSKQSKTMPKPHVIGTGGLAHVVAKASSVFDVIDPDLTLKGIYHIWQLNRSYIPERHMRKPTAQPLIHT